MAAEAGSVDRARMADVAHRPMVGVELGPMVSVLGGFPDCRGGPSQDQPSTVVRSQTVFAANSTMGQSGWLGQAETGT